jgi:adenine-specific DNA-methyltransferase
LIAGGYKGKIDIIYIDPPYGMDNEGEFAKTNYENKVDRDALLSQLEPRLELARQLLNDSGVIFCSIDDRNQAHLKLLFDRIFGEINFLFCIPRQTKKGGKSSSTISLNNDYVLAYRKGNLIEFSKLEMTNIDKFNNEDKYVNERGRYALTQTLDYNSLQ